MSRSLGSPSRSSAARAASRSTNSSCTESTTIAREQALHFCPERPNAERATPSAAASTSARPGHDRRVLAAHLRQRRARVRALLHPAGDLAPDLGGARERDAVDGRLHERPPGVRPALNEVEGAGRKSGGLHDLCEDAPVEGDSSDGLKTTVLPAIRAELDMSHGQRHREVERGDHAEHAVGAQHVRVALALDEAVQRPRVALVLLHVTRVRRRSGRSPPAPPESTRCAICLSRGSRARRAPCDARRSRRPRRAAARSALRTRVPAQPGAAARAASTAWLTSSGPASCARLATRSMRDGSRRSNSSPSATRSPAIRWACGPASWPRAASSAASKAASVSAPRSPLVYVSLVLIARS